MSRFAYPEMNRVLTAHLIARRLIGVGVGVMQPLDTSVLRQDLFTHNFGRTPPGGVAGSQEHACTHSLLTMLTRGKLAVMLLALSSVALSSVAVTSTATNDSSEGKRRMWANACTNMACVCYHMQPIHGHLGVFST
jgi:hypothetical protein